MRVPAALLALVFALGASQGIADTGSFLHISDIHFNPFDPPLRGRALANTAMEDWPAFFAADPDQTLSTYGEDTNHALLAAALGDMAKVAAGADFILVTGDLLAHRFPDNVESVLGFAQGSEANAAFAVRTTLFVAEQLRTALPGKPVFLSLGNNDSGCGDYKIEPGGTYLAATREVVRSLAGPGRVAPDFDASYLAGGYYAAGHPTLADTTIVVLNDVLWSIDYENSCGTAGLDGAKAMMTWFEMQLAAAKASNRKIWLTHHIPVGMDPYATLHSKAETCAARIVPMLAEPFASAYLALLAKYGGTVTASFTGHTHFDDYRLLRDASGAVTGTEKIAPAISPIFGQNPGFHVFTYDRTTGGLVDFATRYLANLDKAKDVASAEWAEEYVFSKAYGVSGFSPAAAESVWKSFATEGAADQTFRGYYNVSRGELSAKGLDAYVCTMGHADADGFRACYCGP